MNDMRNQNNFDETIKHLEYEWQHKWRYFLDDEKTMNMIAELGLPFNQIIGSILDKNSIDPKTSEKLGDHFAYCTHLCFVAGIEFAKFVGPYTGTILDPDEISTRVELKTAFETLPMGQPILMHLASLHTARLLMALGENAFRRDQGEIIDNLTTTLVGYFKVGIKISFYV